MEKLDQSVNSSKGPIEFSKLIDDPNIEPDFSEESDEKLRADMLKLYKELGSHRKEYRMNCVFAYAVWRRDGDADELARKKVLILLEGAISGEAPDSAFATASKITLKTRRNLKPLF